MSALRSALTAALLLAACAREPAPPARPSVVLVSIDTLRADHLGLYGYERDTSPFLDRFAAESLVCEFAWSPCPWTLVAHMTMLTGLFPDQHGVTTGERALADEIPLLAERLLAEGYRTIGLYHPVWVNARHGFQRGFDVFRSHGEADEAEQHLREELAGLDATRPFFLFLHLFDVHKGPIRENQHSIYPSPEPFQEMFQPGATGKLPLVSWNLDPKNGEQREAMTALYDGGIRYVDTKLEQWFGELERRGLLENALVFVTADHGENLLDRGRVLGHGSFWNEGIRVPLLVRHPRGLGAGTRVPENAHLGDVVPTVLDVLDLPADPRLPGSSLFAPLSPERVIIGSMDIGAYVLLGKRKIARGKQKYLTLDLAADPLEKKGKVLEESPEFAMWTARATDPTIRFPPPHEVAPFTPEEAEHLRALGYAGEVDGPGAAEEAEGTP